MTYEVVFDVSERLPQLGVGVVAAIVLVVVIAVGLWDSDVVVARWPLVLGIGAGLLVVVWLLGELWAFALAVVAGTAVVAALEWSNRPTVDEDDGSDHYQPRPPRRVQYGAGGMIVGLFALVLAAGTGLPMIAAFDLQRQLLDGQATVVEGPVMIEERGKSECLVIDAQRFCFSDGSIMPGYNRRQTILGGPFQAGDVVRLSVIAGQIVRVEVGRATG